MQGGRKENKMDIIQQQQQEKISQRNRLIEKLREEINRLREERNSLIAKYNQKHIVITTEGYEPTLTHKRPSEYGIKELFQLVIDIDRLEVAFIDNNKVTWKKILNNNSKSLPKKIRK